MSAFISSPPEPSSSASPTYKFLHSTALGFLAAQAQLPPSSNTIQRIDYPLIASHCSPNFTHTWGHNYAVSKTPPIQGTLSVEAFTSHLDKMIQRLESWDMSVVDVLVDEVRKGVMVRVSYYMKAKGSEEAVENDILWILDMEERTDGKEGMWVKQSKEFVDDVAAGRLKELMMGSAK